MNFLVSLVVSLRFSNQGKLVRICAQIEVSQAAVNYGHCGSMRISAG
jgi:hypothetical protein